ncbi:hypothetical protein AAFF_G00434040 [Aldrovandia affinis]|uniref:Uncharacterized protein n=1 Tax=Aldrovandia affinis TaxID=143900 RepID=A0AAD7S834_9TELE|nr:hypothetical protein AAFF_G00434040 [Aldrovandia affinis]
MCFAHPRGFISRRNKVSHPGGLPCGLNASHPPAPRCLSQPLNVSVAIGSHRHHPPGNIRPAHRTAGLVRFEASPASTRPRIGSMSELSHSHEKHLHRDRAPAATNVYRWRVSIGGSRSGWRRWAQEMGLWEECVGRVLKERLGGLDEYRQTTSGPRLPRRTTRRHGNTRPPRAAASHPNTAEQRGPPCGLTTERKPTDDSSGERTRQPLSPWAVSRLNAWQTPGASPPLANCHHWLRQRRWREE